jgi:RIO kinase 1
MVANRNFEIREILASSFKGKVIVGSITDYFLQKSASLEDFQLDESRLIQSSESASSALVEMKVSKSANNLERIFVKKFHFKGIVHSLKPLFRQHRAQVMWQVSWHLIKNSIPVPQPEGYLIKQRGPFCLEGYFFSKVLSSCYSLEELTKDLRLLSKRLDSGGLIGNLAREVAALHDSGTTHGDLKWSNILIHEEKNELWFVDFDGAKLHSSCPDCKAVARDLARFVLSGLEAGVDGTILARFLGHYVRRRNLKLKDIEGPMMRVLQKLRKRHEKKFQSMR